MKQRHADPEFEAKRIAAFQQKHADPEFEAKRMAAFQQKHADPEFASAYSERMKRRRADPEFEAKRIAALKIPTEMIETIIASLDATPNARQVAKQMKAAGYEVGVTTVWRIAKANDIKLPSRGRPTAKSSRPSRMP